MKLPGDPGQRVGERLGGELPGVEADLGVDRARDVHRQGDRAQILGGAGLVGVAPVVVTAEAQRGARLRVRVRRRIAFRGSGFGGGGNPAAAGV